MEERAVCVSCPHRCILSENKEGACRARVCTDGVVRGDSYGAVTSISLDPIEKKPLKRFYPGSCILSVGSYGCNMHCPFCQNAEISQVSKKEAEYVRMTPKQLSEKAEQLVSCGNIGLAYTYNEPLIGWEFVRDTAKLIQEEKLHNVCVSNGMAADAVLDEVLPLIDAWNIDLKTIRPEKYRDWGGDLYTVQNTVRRAAAGSHVELTTLIIPGENDSPEEMEEISAWIAGIDPEIPLHITRFFPRWHMTDREPTPVQKIKELTEIASQRLKWVYRGNC